jgi:D-alanyl-lipoteichoic acid acyltransferase DltB (MBOAT superfamily)
LFGFNLMTNFKYPYFSRDIAEFWRRWHISLSSWFRDYVYIPLGGSNGTVRRTVINVFIIFLVSGFWHGANWTFVAWGALNALYFVPIFLMKKNRKNLDHVDSFWPGTRNFLNILLTFSLTVLAWIFFRAENMAHAFDYIAGIFSFQGLLTPGQYNIHLHTEALATFPGGGGSYFALVQSHAAVALAFDEGSQPPIPQPPPLPPAPVPALAPLGIAILLSLLGATACWRLRESASAS